MRGTRNAYNILVGRSKRRWEDNIRMGLKETGWEGFIWLRIETSDGLL
jgi:hypothetical protein